MTQRGYQESCYLEYERIREKDRTASKAEKIKEILQRFYTKSLKEALCLDVGCAYGAMTCKLNSIFKSCLGIEYDRFALNAISSECKHLTLFIRGDGMALPFMDNSFEVMICTQVYEHVPDAQDLFKELYRVLKPGGIVVFSGPNKLFPIEPHYFLPFLHWLPEKAADFYLRIFRKGTHYYERLYTPWRLKKMMLPFRVVDINGYVLLRQFKIRSALSTFNPDVQPIWLLSILELILPNLNWILTK